jgi:hypothetical protein
MADTTTPNLKLTNQTEGGNNNTWGTIADANFERIDDKCGDTTDISTTGGTTTLTETQEEVAALQIAGTLISNATIVFSARGGIWVVENNTAGSFSVTCKVSGQTGVTIPQGAACLVFCDGTDIKRGSHGSKLNAIEGLAVTDGNFIVADGSTWTVESGATARTSLGLGTMATQASSSVSITGGTITGITDLAIADGGTGASTAANAFTNLKQEASETATGVVELATTAEATTGTDTSRAVTPAGLKAHVDARSAAASDQETATSTSLFVTPGIQHRHPSAAKAYVQFDSGTGTILGSSTNVSSVTRNGAGDYTINFTNAFSSANYTVIGTLANINASTKFILVRSDFRTTTSCRIYINASNGTPTDSDWVDASVVVYGDL